MTDEQLAAFADALADVARLAADPDTLANDYHDAIGRLGFVAASAGAELVAAARVGLADVAVSDAALAGKERATPERLATYMRAIKARQAALAAYRAATAPAAGD